jgi:hypothetical protein
VVALLFLAINSPHNMTTDEIKIEIEKALAGDRTLMLKGYKSSDGSVKDYVVLLLPDDGYKHLVKTSQEKLNKEVEFFMNEIRPADADIVEWATAIAEQHDSFVKSLSDSKPAKYMQFKNPTVKQGGMHFYQSEFESGAVQTVIIKNVQVLSTTNHTPDKEVKEPKGNIPRYKNLIRSKLPISQYEGQFNLSPDKVDMVKSLFMP